MTKRCSQPCYPSDLSDADWQLAELLLPLPKPRGRPRTTERRQVLSGVFFLLRAGRQCCCLPRNFRLGLPCVERIFAWLSRNRRLGKDYEQTVQSSEAWA